MTIIFGDEDKLRCAERELKMRRRVYPRWVEEGRMSVGKAEYEIGCMEAICEDFRVRVEKERLL
jgi:hypothetical protein